MSTCGSCGSCNGCSGCAKQLVLTPDEVDMLLTFGQTPFLPVARKASDTTPVYLEETQKTPEEYSLILACLEKKGLIDMDYHRKLSGFDYQAYAKYPLQGSMALTARGLSVLESLDLWGIEGE